MHVIMQHGSGPGQILGMVGPVFRPLGWARPDYRLDSVTGTGDTVFL